MIYKAPTSDLSRELSVDDNDDDDDDDDDVDDVWLQTTQWADAGETRMEGSDCGLQVSAWIHSPAPRLSSGKHLHVRCLR